MKAIIVPYTSDMNALAEITLPYIEAYSRRCGATLYLLRGMPPAYQHPKYRVFEVGNRESVTLADIPDDARVLILDLDVVIRPDAPDIFKAHPQGNYMLDETPLYPHGRFDWHKRGIRAQLFLAGIRSEDDVFADGRWYNPGVSLLDMRDARKIFAMPPWDVTDAEHTFGQPPIVKNMPWINWRIRAEGVDMRPLGQRWNCFTSRTQDVPDAHFVHCACGPRVDKVALAKQETEAYKARRRRYHVHFVEGGIAGRGWILERMGDEIRGRKPDNVSVSVGNVSLDEPGVINHYNCYLMYRVKSAHAVDCGQFTHPGYPMRWEKAGAFCDHAVAKCRTYYDLLIRDSGRDSKNTSLIYPGCDIDFHAPKFRVFQPSKMTSAQSYRQRKGVELWERLKEIDGLDCVCSGGKMSPEQVIAQYWRADAIVSTATMEGGPMSVPEALAMGRTVYARRGVGLVDDYASTGVKGLVLYDSDGHLIEMLTDKAQERQTEYAKVGAWSTWDRYAADYWALFGRLADKHDLSYTGTVALKTKTARRAETPRRDKNGVLNFL